MKVLKNTKINYIPPVSMPIDNLSDLPYIPASPLPAKSFALYVVGQPGSGKTSYYYHIQLKKIRLYLVSIIDTLTTCG